MKLFGFRSSEVHGFLKFVYNNKINAGHNEDQADRFSERGCPLDLLPL